jgi:hypothetical protein
MPLPERGIAPLQQSVTGVGVTLPLPVIAPAHGTYGGNPPSQQPGILCFVTGTVTYNIEVTGDKVDSPGYSPASGNWLPLPNMTGIVNINALTTLGAVVTAIRGHITSGNGTLLVQFCQFTG